MIVAGVAFGLLALGLLVGCLAGSGNVVAEERKAGPFSELEVGGGWTVDISIGEPQLVVLEADDNILEIIRTEVSGGRLHIRSDQSYLNPTRLVATIVVPELKGLDVSGGTSVTVSGPVRAEQFRAEASGGSHIHIADLEAEQLDVDLSGGSSIEAAGVAEELDIEASGGSPARLRDLQARSARVDISGGSQVELYVTESLTGEASGGSGIRVNGSPARTDVKTSGGSSVTSR